MSGNNIILDKTFQFSKKIIFLYLELKNEKEFDLGRQVLRSGTSIGANIEEAQGAISKKDFISKVHISLKEAKETHYWLRLFKECKIVSLDKVNELLHDCTQIIKILTSILNSAKKTE